MKFTFKIWDKIKEAWPIYKTQFSMFLLLILVTMVIKVVGNSDGVILPILSFFVGVGLYYLWIRYSLDLVDKKDFNPFKKESLPSLKQYWNFLKLIVLLFFIYIASLILFIVPLLYISGRLMFATYLSVEKNQGARLCIKESWNMTKGYGWILFWKGFLICLFIFIGFIILLVGGLITYPIGIIVMAMMYREFLKMKSLASVAADTVTPSPEPVKELPKEEILAEVKEEVKEVVKEENPEIIN